MEHIKQTVQIEKVKSYAPKTKYSPHKRTC